MPPPTPAAVSRYLNITRYTSRGQQREVCVLYRSSKKRSCTWTNENRRKSRSFRMSAGTVRTGEGIASASLLRYCRCHHEADTLSCRGNLLHPGRPLGAALLSHSQHSWPQGQAVPQGSHVRLNLQTGEREVRLGEEQLKYWTEEHREEEALRSSFNPDELKRAMKKIKEDWKLASKDTEQKDSVASKFRTMEELKKDMAQLDLLLETDVQIMRRLLEQFNSSNSTSEQRLSILTELEYLVHQVDNAQTLCSMGGLQFLLEGLNSSDFRLQESSAFVLGSALASNPAVQVEAVENGALQTLLTTLATAQQLRVQKKVLFAVASLLRHFPYAQRHFLTHGGLQVLSELFRTDNSGILRTRIVTMLYDMITEKELIFQGGLDPVLDASHDERRRQYSKVSLQEELLEKGWCILVPQLLESSENDYREKALQALLAMAPVCLDQYRSDGSLQASLHSLKQEYQDMIQSEIILAEENSYFEEIVELIDALQVKMK
ncbi:nucleotide exchange factor SIL1 isoform X2 [Haplochromis burtoni]|uniref:Nucleotide exchange factor SIL1 n=1 Tax=Haplochromis burtoni TaxID=8153 RepID=A0A3Q2V9G8_HAPBU|nr:nucleotide exchange factor SIL1 isoform X2 [Haplochromis burtoni]